MASGAALTSGLAHTAASSTHCRCRLSSQTMGRVRLSGARSTAFQMLLELMRDPRRVKLSGGEHLRHADALFRHRTVRGAPVDAAPDRGCGAPTGRIRTLREMPDDGVLVTCCRALAATPPRCVCCWWTIRHAFTGN
jgi:hypothetical protein